MIKRKEIVGDLSRAKKTIDFWRRHAKTEGMDGLSVSLEKISGELGDWITTLQEASEITFPEEEKQ